MIPEVMLLMLQEIFLEFDQCLKVFIFLFIFIGTDSHGNTGFASEAKCLVDWCDDVKPFPPSHYWDSKT